MGGRWAPGLLRTPARHSLFRLPEDAESRVPILTSPGKVRAALVGSDGVGMSPGSHSTSPSPYCVCPHLLSAPYFLAAPTPTEKGPPPPPYPSATTRQAVSPPRLYSVLVLLVKATVAGLVQINVDLESTPLICWGYCHENTAESEATTPNAPTG